MAAKNGHCSHQLDEKLARNGVRCENNNYVYRKTVQRKQRDFTNVLYYGFIGLVSVLCYLNSLFGDLVHDDIMAIQNNRDVHGSTSLLEVFQNDFWGKSMTDNTSHKSYRPLCVLTFRVNYMVCGLHPLGYHVVNVALHCVATLLFTWTCQVVIFNQLHAATLAGVIFATHPVHTEAVAGIVGRADVLACVLVLLSFLLYIRSIDTRWPSYFPSTECPWLFGASLVCAACAMLVKEHGITVLAICALYDVFIICHAGLSRILEERRINRMCIPLALRLLAVASLIVVLLSLRLWMLNGQLPAFTDQDNPAAFHPSLFTRCLSYWYLLAFNAWLLLCPATLSYDWQMHSIPLIESITDFRNLATAAFILTLSLLSCHTISLPHGARKKSQSAGLMFLVLPFLPASNLFFKVGFVVAERILYIPSMGYVILIVSGLESLMYKFRRKARVLTGITLGLGLLFAARTISRNQVWQSREALFKSGLHTLPHNAKMHYNYANFLKDTNYKQEAIHHYQMALQLWPNHASANNNLGTLLSDPREAEKHYRQAIRINPVHGGAFFNLGNLLQSQGRHVEALDALHRAVQISPEDPDPHVNLASINNEMGNHVDAEYHYRRVVELNPTDSNGYNNLGVFLNQQGYHKAALGNYEKAYTLQPDHQVAIVNAARLHRTLKRDEEAEKLYRRALTIKRDPDTLDLTGIFYFNTGRPKQAMDLFSEVLQTDPQHTNGRVHFAQALAKEGHHQHAEQLLQGVVSGNGDHIEALHQLANLYGLKQKHQQALECLERAIALTHDSMQKAAFYFEQGNHHKDLNDLKQAFQSYKTAVGLNPNIAEAQLNLGVLYHTMGEYPEARAHYMEAARLQPDNPVLRDNLRKLDRAEQKKSNR